jgi:hypothetical protein
MLWVAARCLVLEYCNAFFLLHKASYSSYCLYKTSDIYEVAALVQFFLSLYLCYSHDAAFLPS